MTRATISTEYDSTFCFSVVGFSKSKTGFPETTDEFPTPHVGSRLGSRPRARPRPAAPHTRQTSRHSAVGTRVGATHVHERSGHPRPVSLVFSTSFIRMRMHGPWCAAALRCASLPAAVTLARPSPKPRPAVSTRRPREFRSHGLGGSDRQRASSTCSETQTSGCAFVLT